MKTENPFVISGYIGPDFFCDREEETGVLIRNAENGINSTLVSIRRMGKSGLIWHTMEKLSGKGIFTCIYADIYATQTLREFTNKIGTSILQAVPEKKTIGKKFSDLLKGLRPVISYDTLTGQPQVSFTFSSQQQNEQSLEALLRFLDSLGKPVLLAIDEFQQITNYPEKNTEALLRSQLQFMKNIRLIFSGSSHHLLTEMFSNGNRPFFASTQFLFLKEIKRDLYKEFIREIFGRYNIKVDEESLDFLSDFSRLHTFYTQSICNRLFSTGLRSIKINDVRETCSKLISENEQLFFQYRNLLTSVQWNLLKAIAKEGKVFKPNAGAFIEKYRIGIPASIQRALESLLNKEMIYRGNDQEGSFYSVYDLFLSRWMETVD